jgi:uncharacterized protein (TIGR03083 family)
MDPIGVLSRALDQTGNLLDHVNTDVLERPTPCSDWDVAALADHLVNDPRQFLLMVRGEQPDWSAPTPHVTQAWGQTFRASADELVQAMQGLGESPPLPPEMQLAEFAVHGWDLATALDLPLDGLDPEVAELGLEFMQANLKPEMRTGAFGPEQPAPPDAGPYDRIAAFAGRRVAQ